MHILVTGAAGFIGSHLVDSLLRQGHSVTGIDSLVTGSHQNITHLESHDSFRFMEHDIVEPLFIDTPIDQIYNLACPASPVQYQTNPVRTIKTNTIGVINMLGLARKHGARILQASTSEVYGDPEVHPQPEEYRGAVSTTGPRACYDEGKRCGETLMFDYHRMHELDIKVIRIFNTYGPRMAFDDGRVVSNFIIQALQNKDITIFGDGLQTRSFCYVSDLVRGIEAMMHSNAEVHGPVNLGNPDEFTIRELADLVLELTGSKSIIDTSTALPQDDPRRRKPDISLAKELLEWEPTIALRDGLQMTIEEFKERLASAN